MMCCVVYGHTWIEEKRARVEEDLRALYLASLVG